MKQANLGRAFKAGVIMALTGALCVFLILTAQEKTASLIKSNQDARLAAMVSSLLPIEDESRLNLKCNLISDPRIGQNMRLLSAYEGEKLAGYIMQHSTSCGYSNPLILISGFTPDKKIYKTDIQISNETPGLGDKVDRHHGNFMDAFNGLGLGDKNFEVKKFGGDFDYITGATVTSRAVVLAAFDALSVINEKDLSRLPVCKDKL